MNCSQIKETTYREFSEHIHTKAVKDNIPINGTIELTTHCNLRCVHCYIQDNTTTNELTYTEVCSLIDQIVDAGCLWLLFTGGEPFVRNDFLDIYTHAKKKGLIITIFTNGTLITPEIAECLKELSPFSIEITLYGATKETYEKVTGVPGSYNRCINGIKCLTKRNLPLKLKTMLLSFNQHELEDSKMFAESLGLNFKYDPNINPTLKKSLDPCRYRLSPDEVVALDGQDEKRSAEWIRLWNKFKSPQKTDTIFDCEAGKNSFHINPRGHLQVCEMVQKPFFDIRKLSFLEAYNRFNEILSKPPGKDYTCGGCEITLFCDYCAGWSDLENSNMEKKVDYLCEIAHKRAEHFTA